MGILAIFLLMGCSQKVELPPTSPWIENQVSETITFHGVPVEILDRLIQSESSWNHNAVNNSHGERSIGLAQVNTKWLSYFRERFGLQDPLNPWQAVEFAAKYLYFLYEQTGIWEDAIIAYKAGLQRVHRVGPQLRRLARWVATGVKYEESEIAEE